MAQRKYLTLVTIVLLLQIHLTIALTEKKVEQIHVSNPISVESNGKQADLLTYGFSGILWKFIQDGSIRSLNLSDQCLKSFDHVLKSLEEGKPEAFQFLEASGRLPSKFLEGSFSDFGNYEKCLDFSRSSSWIQSHYCLTSMLPNFNSSASIYPHNFQPEFDALVKIGFCLPFSCNPGEVETIVEEALKPYSWQLLKVDGCEVQSSFMERFDKADGYQKASIILLGFIIMLVVWSSLIELYHKWFNGPVSWYKNHWLKHFSLQNTRRNLVEDETSGPRVHFIDTFRILMVLTVLIQHGFTMYSIGRMMFLVESSSALEGIAKSPAFQPINSDWSYDWIIYFGATVSVVSLWRKMTDKTSISTYVKSIFKRLFLYWPILIVCIALEISLPLFGSGPVYSHITQWRSKTSQRTFWYTLLHVQNYLFPFDMCLGQSWSMAAELHLYVLGCILVYLYKTRPRLGLTVNILAMVLGLGWVFWLFYSYDIAPYFLGLKLDWSQIMRRADVAYFPTGCHLFTYSFSILAFYLDSKYNFISKTLRGKVSKVLIALVILQSYSTSIWNIYEFEGSPMKYGLHAIALKSISAFFFMWVVSKFSLKPTSPPVTKNPSPSKGGRSVENDENENVTEKTKPRSGKYSRSYTVLLAASRSAYFVHMFLYYWYFARKTTVYLDSRLLSETIYLVILSFFAGLLFHFLVMGPFESFLSSSMSRKSSKKSHSS